MYHTRRSSRITKSKAVPNGDSSYDGSKPARSSKRKKTEETEFISTRSNSKQSSRRGTKITVGRNYPSRSTTTKNSSEVEEPTKTTPSKFPSNKGNQCVDAVSDKKDIVEKPHLVNVEDNESLSLKMLKDRTEETEKKESLDKKSCQRAEEKDNGTVLSVSSADLTKPTVDCSTQTDQKIITVDTSTSKDIYIPVLTSNGEKVYKLCKMVEYAEGHIIIDESENVSTGANQDLIAEENTGLFITKEEPQADQAEDFIQDVQNSDGSPQDISDTAEQLLRLGQTVMQPEIEHHVEDTLVAALEESDSLEEENSVVTQIVQVLTPEDLSIESNAPNYKIKPRQRSRKKEDKDDREKMSGHCVEKKVECTDCHRMFASEKSLKLHRKIRCMKVANNERPFKCDRCDKGYITADDLRKHKLTHDKIKIEKRFSCPDCGKCFTSERGLTTHIKRQCPERLQGVPTDAGILYCKVCGSAHLSAEELQLHEETHSEEEKNAESAKAHRCAVCYKRYDTEDELHEHAKDHLDTAFYKCNYCDMTFRVEQYLKNHMKTHADEIRKECSICGETFATASSLDVHVATHTGVKPYQCGICGKGAASMASMKNHMILHAHDKPFKCKYCQKGFARKPALKEHERIHTGEKPFTCELCGKAFTLNNTLKVHMMRHTGERPFKCEHCGKGFLNNHILNDHLRTHTGEKPFMCPICEKSFATRANLGAHVRLHSGEKRFHCSQCGKGFTSKAKMQIHEEAHNGNVSHKCHVCGKGFVRKDSLFTHLRIHRTGRQHLCSVCGNKYSSQSALKVHFKNHLAVKPFECGICGKAFTRSDVWKKHISYHMRHLDDLPGGQLEIIEVSPDENMVEIHVKNEDEAAAAVASVSQEQEVVCMEVPLTEHDENMVEVFVQNEHSENVMVHSETGENIIVQAEAEEYSGNVIVQTETNEKEIIHTVQVEIEKDV